VLPTSESVLEAQASGRGSHLLEAYSGSQRNSMSTLGGAGSHRAIRSRRIRGGDLGTIC